jgi:hypothetical protein
MVHPGLVSCHISMEKIISFTSMMVQMLLTNRLRARMWSSDNCLGTHLLHTFPIPEVIMHNIVSRAVTHVEFYGNFIYSDLPVVMDSLLDLLFHCLSCHANWSPTPVSITDVLFSILKSFHPSYTLPSLKQCFHSSVDFRRFHILWPQKTNNATLLFHHVSSQWSGHVVQAIAQVHTARTSRPLYGILLRSHFVYRNKIFRCAYFSKKKKKKFLLFNDFPS